jgi:hypothetical protein
MGCFMEAVSRERYAMAFVDGQNLYQHAKDAFGHHHPNYDLVKLHAAVCAANGWTPTLVRFCTGVPDTQHEPMWAGYWTNRIRAMKRAGVHVTTRPLRYRTRMAFDAQGNEKAVVVPQEKGIDTRMVLDMVSTARKRQWDVAVVFSQDQDLAEVVDEIKGIGREQARDLLVCCAFPGGPNASAKRGIDRSQWFPMSREFYDQCLDPVDYRPLAHRTGDR